MPALYSSLLPSLRIRSKPVSVASLRHRLEQSWTAARPKLSALASRKERAVKHALTFDPREVDAYVSKLDERRELVYRLAIRGLRVRCGADRRFRVRTEELRRWFATDLDAIEAEADGLARELAERR